MIDTILEIVLVGLKFLSQEHQEAINKKILDLRTNYAEEIARPYRPIEEGEVVNEDSRPVDGAKLYSLKRELRDILQLYCTAVQGTKAASEPN